MNKRLKCQVRTRTMLKRYKNIKLINEVDEIAGLNVKDLRGQCEIIVEDLKNTKILRSGACGKIYDLNSLVLKVQLPSNEWTEDEQLLYWERECKTQQIAADNELAPKIHDAWICDTKRFENTKFMMIMDKMDGSLELINKYSLEQQKIFVNQINKLVEKLHSIEFYIEILNLKIFYIKKELHSPINNNIRLYLADFGLAEFVDKNELNVFKEDLDSLSYFDNFIKRNNN